MITFKLNKLLQTDPKPQLHRPDLGFQRIINTLSEYTFTGTELRIESFITRKCKEIIAGNIYNRVLKCTLPYRNIIR